MNNCPQQVKPKSKIGIESEYVSVLLAGVELVSLRQFVHVPDKRC